MKGQVLHCARANLKVPGLSLVWNELLTKKLRTFLSRLNEMSGGCKKIVPVSGLFWSNLKFLRIMDLNRENEERNSRISFALLFHNTV